MARKQPVRVLTGDDVRSLLEGREADILEAVKGAYLAHGRGESSLPHSTFLRFPDQPRNRIIALPAYLASDRTAGIKWISSFPANTDHGIERASALIALNCTQTGRVKAILEGAIISARRTAASAALAALHLAGPDVPAVSFVGGGLISTEVLRFMARLIPSVRRASVFDLDRGHAEAFLRQARKVAPGVDIVVASSLGEALRATVICFATTSLAPYVSSLDACRKDATVLHLSLRDLTAECALECDNVVDDIDHVCRAGTSLHLAEEKAGHRDFIRCTLADVLAGRQPARPADPERVTVFSPFGLGVLDIAVAQLACRLADEAGGGLVLESFAATNEASP